MPTYLRVSIVLLCLFTALCLTVPMAAQTSDKVGQIWTLPWDADWVTSVCFLGNNRVAAGNNLGQIVVWDLPETNGGPAPLPVRRLEGHTNTINRMLATPDGRWLISASSDHTVRYWDMEAKGKKSEAIVMNAVAVDEANAKKRKPVAAVEGKVDVQEASRILEGHQDWVLGLTLTPDGKTLVTGDDKGEIIVWDRESGKEVRRWKSKGWVWALAIAPYAQTLVASERLPLVFDSGRHSALKLWNPQTAELKADLTKDVDKQMIAAAAFSPDGKWLAILRGGETDGQNGKVILLDPVSGKKLREFGAGHLNGGTDLAFHPDGKHLLSSGRDTTVRVWNLADGKLVKELGQGRGGQFKDWIHSVSVSPDGKRVAGADMAGQVQIWAFESK